ncbi:hypothetical protein MO973_38255 [Paenibacillus sp. TRM 82003]|uniref:hypothetical protein n=1 Tax=Kineococcus sp. TRM81007 TaxID=2925831 RepID=UPI001F5962C2|nr:hypothetical protein [Kineococcus sp. TRM81007]MCI2238034.1 hypothetical protein [Kineococcus sp. TRM81007]MCI3926049.1 hypothetical protein [Paenibacillus sp. TRM 82003]
MSATGLSGGPAGELTARGRTDGFGTGALRWWRRLGGAGVVALLALAFGALATGEDGTDRDSGFWALIVLACTYAGVPLSRLVSGVAHGAALVARHALAGAGLGLVSAVVLDVAFHSDDVGSVLLVPLLICLPAGALVGAGTAVLALLVPRRAAVGLALVGVAATAALAWLTFRPAAPYDLFAVDATPEVAAAGGATGLAERTREAVQDAGAGQDLRTATVWRGAGEQVTAGLGPSRPHLRFTPTEDLAVSRAGGQAVRLITVRVRGQSAACVVVDAGATDVLDGACDDLDPVR